MSGSASSSIVATLAILPSRCATASESRSRAWASESAAKTGRISAPSSPCWSLRAWPRQSRRKCTVQRCQLHADQAAPDQATQEGGPERLGLGLADVDREDLAAAGLMDTMRDHERLVDDAPAVAHLLDLGVEEEVWVAALQRPGPERVNVLVQRRTDATDLAPGNAQPEALDQLVDASCRHAAHIRLLDHRQQRLLRAPARLQKRREIAPLPDLRDLQLDFARPGVPAPGPIAVAMRCPVRGSALAALSADQLGDLELHHLRRAGLDRLADHVGVLIEQHLPDDLLDRHPVGTGHAAPPFVRAVESPTIFSAASAGTTFRPTSTYTTLRDVTGRGGPSR